MSEIREGIERLKAANEAAKLVEALRVAAEALAYYAGSDDPRRANEAVQEIERLMWPDRVAKSLREDSA